MKKYYLNKVSFLVLLLSLLVVSPSKLFASSYIVSLVPGCTTTTGVNSSGVSCSSQTMIKFTNAIDTVQERKDVQSVLNKVMVPSLNLTVDGVFGTSTIVAIKAFQTAHGLTVDGKVGTKTRSALQQAQIDYYKTPTNVCTNGATNYPTCTITTNSCTNGATNYPTCAITSFSRSYISSVSASTYDTTNNKTPQMSIDNDISAENRWAGQGDGAWLAYTFTSNIQLSNIDILFYKANTRVTKFSLAYSLDNSTWTAIGDYSSSGTATTFERFTFPSTITAKYFKIIGHGNSEVGSSTWTSIMEVNFNPSSTIICPANMPDPTTFCPNGTIVPATKDANGCTTSYSCVTTADTTAPTISTFTIPTTSTALAVTGITLTATDNVAVTGYYLSESSTAPTTSSTWLTSVPTSFTFTSSGANTLYAWARDAAGNISASKIATTTITLACSGSATQTCTITNGTGSQSRTCTNGTWGSYGTCTVTSCNDFYQQIGNTCTLAGGGPTDITLPVINSFIVPSTSTTLAVPITTFIATDNVAVTGYLVNESSTKPAATASGWTTTAPMTYTSTSSGSKTLYAWAKDAAGNISAYKSASIAISLPSTVDTTAPTISTFTIPTTSTALAVTGITLTATDNVAVTGYYLSESSTAPTTSSTWLTSVPTSFTFTSSGANTLYAWARDAAGNISASKIATTTITLACSGSATQTCTITNGTGSQSRTCTNGTWGSYGTCTVTACNTGYAISGNTCVASTSSTGNTYYISNSGSDSNAGTSTTAPWKTIAKVNSTTLKAGDSVLFERGGTWRESLTVSASGTSSNYITFGNYGDATKAKPRMVGSTQLTGWTNTGTNVWQSSLSVTNPHSVGNYGGEVIFENTNGTKSWGTFSSGTPSATYQWSYSSNKVSVYSTSDPTTNYKAVEAPQRADIMNLNYKNYIKIDGIDFFYSGQTGIAYAPDEPTMVAQTGLIIQNVEVAYISVKDSEQGYGIEALYSDMTVKNSVFHDCGRRPISLHLYGSASVNNILIDNNQFYSGWHTTGPDIQVGSGYTGNITNVTIRNNTIYEPKDRAYYYSEGLYLSNKGSGAKMDNISIYNNTFMNHSGYGILMESIQGAVYIYNNTFYGYDSTSSRYPHISVQALNGLPSISVAIKNNIFMSDTSSGEGIEVYGTGQSSSAVTSSNNLIYNCSSAVSGTTTADPKFVSVTSADLHLNSGSPAIGKGVSVGLTTDKDGNAYNNPPSIGAYEYGYVLGASKYNFTLNLKYGSTGNEVTELQKVLVSSGYLKATPNGKFGPATEAALKKYQKANILTSDGVMGAQTRKVLNQ